jgi:uncharacterized membrane protein HdeD (DUF308 family)
MIQLTFLLLGAEAVRRHWIVLAAVGVTWALLGIAIMTESFEHIRGYTMHILGVLLVVEGCATMLARVAGHRARLWHIKALALILPGLAIIETPLRNLMLVSILFGLALITDSIVRTISIFLVRFPGWRLALFGTSVEFILALLALTPWPVTYEATIPFCVSVALMLSGWTILRSALALRALPPGPPITSLPIFEQERGWHASVFLPAERKPAADGTLMVVHVWTATATTVNPRRRPILDRYVAAVDREGTVSTGHAALEMAPDIYISHYRVADNERSGSEFRQSLHAGVQNNAPGRFLPGYAAEAAEWCEATEHVEFQNFSAERLRAFWDEYRTDSTYNLTNRNCSVAVALALDAALEGALAEHAVWPSFLRLAVSPELHLATLLRQRAHTMTWTPGLVLDYARAVQRVVEPPPLPWPAMVGQAFVRWRRIRKVHARAKRRMVRRGEGKASASF